MALERKDGGATSANNNGYPSTAYGPTDPGQVDAKGTEYASTGKKDTYEVEYLIDFGDSSQQPTTSENDNQILTFPAFAVIKDVDVTVLETVSGGTNFNLGLSQPDGTVIDADGLVAASSVTAVGAYQAGNGALVGASIGSAEGQLTLGGTRTAGKVKVRIEYIQYNS